MLCKVYIIKYLPASSPNFLLGAIIYAFITSVSLTSRLFDAAVIKNMHSLFPVTTLECVITPCVFVTWSPAFRHAFLLQEFTRFSPTPYGHQNTKTLWGFSPLGMVWNVTFTFSISFCMASCQIKFQFFSLMATASLTSSSPNIWVLF